MLPTVILPLAGLGVDGARAYLVKSKLVTAIDGGAIAAAASLANGASSAAQTSNATATVKQFVNANFPANYFGASLRAAPTVCVDLGDGNNPCGLKTGGTVDTFKKRTVIITAFADVPTTFLRILGFNNVSVRADGRASRRDVRVVLVIDRSVSMNDINADTKNMAIVDAVNQAGIFVGKFAPLRDELGLVVMGGSAIVAYPPRDPTLDPTLLASFKPPNTNWSPAVLKGSVTPKGDYALPYLISRIKGGSNTGMSEALYLAYMTLKADAATNTALKNMLNVIVFFTDGLPNGITTYANDPARNSLDLTTPSPCTYRNQGTNFPMIGWFAQGNGNIANDKKGGLGLHKQMMTTQYAGITGKDMDQWMQNPTKDSTTPALNIDNCAAQDNGGYIKFDFSKIPDQDLYGNSTNFKAGGTSWYPQGNYYKNNGKIAFDPTITNDSYQVGLASWNATADQCWKIWNNKIYVPGTGTTKGIIIDDPSPIDPVIFTIGYAHGGEPPDDQLMRIMANDINSPVVVSTLATKIKGKYYLATSADQVNSAFADIASEILRLAQ